MGEKQIDLELVRRVQAGDKSAFDVLVLKYQQKVINLVMRYVHDPSYCDGCFSRIIPSKPTVA